jgi:hypothetical protein
VVTILHDRRGGVRRCSTAAKQASDGSTQIQADADIASRTAAAPWAIDDGRRRSSQFLANMSHSSGHR